jgi:hypothetical protein
MLVKWVQRRAEWNAAIMTDARRLIETYREFAYSEARERVRGGCIEAIGPSGIGRPSNARSPASRE